MCHVLFWELHTLILRLAAVWGNSSVDLNKWWREADILPVICMFDLFPGRNTKHSPGKAEESIHPHLLSCSHSSITPAGLSTYREPNFQFKSQSCWIPEVVEPRASRGTRAIQIATGDISTFLSSPMSDCLCKQRLISDCWQLCSSGVWLFVTLPRDCPPACNWLLCVFLLDTKHSPPSFLSLQVLHLYHSIIPKDVYKKATKRFLKDTSLFSCFDLCLLFFPISPLWIQ